jgi:hypothetical protein
MTNTENLNYAGLIRNTKVQNTQTSEHGVITASGNGLVGITLTDGLDAGEEITMSPAEAITYWRAIRNETKPIL